LVVSTFVSTFGRRRGSGHDCGLLRTRQPCPGWSALCGVLRPDAMGARPHPGLHIGPSPSDGTLGEADRGRELTGAPESPKGRPADSQQVADIRRTEELELVGVRWSSAALQDVSRHRYPTL
jgi:hypothetical protein